MKKQLPKQGQASLNVLRMAAFQLCGAAAGFFLTKCHIFSDISAFAPAFAAALPARYVLTALSGCAAAALSFDSGDLIGREIACVCACAVINCGLSRFIKRGKKPVFAAAATFICFALSGLLAVFYRGFSTLDMAKIAADSVISCITAYFFSVFFGTLRDISNEKMSGRGFASVCVTLSAIIMSTDSFDLFGFVPARAAAVFLTLLFSFIGSLNEGCVFAVCVSTALSAASGIPLSAGFTVGALAAGAVGRGQVFCASAFTAVNIFFAVVLCGDDAFALCLENLAADLVFILIRSGFLENLSRKFSDREASCASTAIKTAGEKISLMSRNLMKISKTIKRIAEKAKENKEFSPESDSLSDSFEICSLLLGSLYKSTDAQVYRLPEKTYAVSSALERTGSTVEGADCFTDEAGRLHINAVVKNFDERTELTQLKKCLEKSCGAELSLPIITKDGEKHFINAYQRENYRLRVSAIQFSQNEGDPCGDYYITFNDAQGYGYVVLSDGMGTGRKAAEDAAVTAEIFKSLIIAGVDINAALDITNRVLCAKDVREKLATLDVLKVNLFSGEAELYKAGSAASFIKSGKGTGRIELKSLPIGILGGVKFESAHICLKQGDAVVIVSDGIPGTEKPWIEAYLSENGSNDAKEIVQKIAAGSAKYTNEKKRDDMTVIAAVVK